MKIQPLWLLAAFSLLSCDVLFPGEDNPNNCIKNANLCTQSGQVCNGATGRCVDANGMCSQPIDCLTAAGAYCKNNQCVPCDADNVCLAWSTQRNESPLKPYCISGSCVQCKTNAECTDANKPACDASGTAGVNGICRACAKDSECGTGICRKPGDYPETPPSGLSTGQCVKSTDIVYVDKGNGSCSDSGSGTMAAPFCTVDKGVMSGKPFVKVAGYSGSYAVSVINSGNVTIVGSGRGAATPTKFDSIDVNGATVVVSEAQVLAASGNAVTCRGGASLYLTGVAIVATTGRGVDAQIGNGCSKLYVERSRITSQKFGMILGGMSGSNTLTYRLVNTAFSSNAVGGSGTEPQAVYIDTNASGYFGFNTITRYTSGVFCMSSQPLEDSIITGVTNMNSEATNCTVAHHVYTGTNVDLASGLEPMLMNNAKADACCVNQDSTPSANPGVSVDYFNTPRPLGGIYDIGFQELK